MTPPYEKRNVIINTSNYAKYLWDIISPYWAAKYGLPIKTELEYV